MSDIIEFNNVTIRYNKHIALHDISGRFHAGSLTAIAGPNGAGKSTLLKAIMGITKPSAGSITINGNPTIAYLPQTATIQRDFPISVLDAVCTGFWAKAGNMGEIDDGMISQARAALAEVGLAGFETRQIAALSGGQFQRMLFARTIVQDASVILLDEPFTAIDAETTARLIRILLGWHQEKRTVICVLHDLLLIQKYFPDSFVLAGKCLGHGHTHKMLEQKLLSFDLDMAELCPGPEAEAHVQHEAGKHIHSHDCAHDHD